MLTVRVDWFVAYDVWGDLCFGVVIVAGFVCLSLFGCLAGVRLWIAIGFAIAFGLRV